MKINKRGGMIGYTFFLISFIFIWAVWLGNFLSEQGQNYITLNSATGLEAFFYANLNLWLLFCLLGGTFLYYFYGGNQ